MLDSDPAHKWIQGNDEPDLLTQWRQKLWKEDLRICLIIFCNFGMLLHITRKNAPLREKMPFYSTVNCYKCPGVGLALISFNLCWIWRFQYQLYMDNCIKLYSFIQYILAVLKGLVQPNSITISCFPLLASSCANSLGFLCSDFKISDKSKQ